MKFFSGTMKSEFTCQKCGTKNDKIENFFIFSLTLPEVKVRMYSFIFVPKYSSKVWHPEKYGITLSTKATAQDLSIAIDRSPELK